MPLKNALLPSSRQILLVTDTTLWRCLASISRVLSTSSGVVSPAATAPDTEPYNADSKAVTSFGLDAKGLWRRDHFFIPSHSGNCMTVNGTSRMIVMLQPRYSSRHTWTKPCVLRCASMDVSADMLVGYWPACARCFTTSVGTRTAHAATSPRLAASICDAASP